MPVDDDFLDRSCKAAIRALGGLEQTAIMLETYAPEVFPEINEQRQKHFGRVMMESAAEAIRDAWASAISEVSNQPIAVEVEAEERIRDAANDLLTALKGLLPEGWGVDDTMDHMPGVRAARLAIAKAEGRDAAANLPVGRE